MRGKSQFRNSLLVAITLTVAIALIVLLAAVPAWAQNPVPPTAREAAASPAFAAKLHPVRRPAANKVRFNNLEPLSGRGGHSPTPLAGSRTASSGSGCAEPSPQDIWDVIYVNGPLNGTTDAWTINFGYSVSDTFVPSLGRVNGFDLYVWELPGDKLNSVQWSITSGPNSGTIYGSGTVSGSNLTDTFISTNQYGFDIDKISAVGLNVPLASNEQYWVNLFNAVTTQGEGVYWDENSGEGCYFYGCPSQANESGVGTIPSEAFDVSIDCGACGCSPGSPPPPPSGCFQSSGPVQVVHDFTAQEGSGSGVSIDKAGNLYGTTGAGGADGAGLVYKLSPRGQGWVLNPLYSLLGGSDGSGPSPVIFGPDGALYGTAQGGMDNCSGWGSCGLVFRLRPAPTACLTALCSWTESALYEPNGNKDAFGPRNLVFDQAGHLYGTSQWGGAYGDGAVFELVPFNGGWKEITAYSFDWYNGGAVTPSSLVAGNDGNLYGTGMGNDSDGIVFQLVPTGGGWTQNVIYTFWGEGWEPWGLAQDDAGNLFGLALNLNNPWPGSAYPVEIFMLSASEGSWVFSLPYKSPFYYYGSHATSGFATDAAGNVYIAIGHADPGGQRDLPADSGDYWWGTVMMRPPGGNFSQIWYSGDIEFTPSGPLAIDADGNIYGTTSDCGKNGYGSVWKLTP